MPFEAVLSPLDLRILEELQANALIDDSELAAKLNAPETLIRARIEWLEDNVITGYVANIDWDAIDFAELDAIDLQILAELSQPRNDLRAARRGFNPRRRN